MAPAERTPKAGVRRGRSPQAATAVRSPAAGTTRSAPPGPPPLDEVDRAILRQLQADGRLPYTRIGAAVGLSEAAARQRVQRLLDTGVMQVVAVTDPLSLGMGRMAMIGVRAEGDLDTVAAQLGALDDVEYLVVVAGSFDFLLEVVVEDDEALLDVMNRVRAVSGVRETETYVYLKLAKQTFEWGTH